MLSLHLQIITACPTGTHLKLHTFSWQLRLLDTRGGLKDKLRWNRVCTWEPSQGQHAQFIKQTEMQPCTFTLSSVSVTGLQRTKPTRKPNTAVLCSLSCLFDAQEMTSDRLFVWQKVSITLWLGPSFSLYIEVENLTLAKFIDISINDELYSRYIPIMDNLMKQNN